MLKFFMPGRHLILAVDESGVLDLDFDLLPDQGRKGGAIIYFNQTLIAYFRTSQESSQGRWRFDFINPQLRKQWLALFIWVYFGRIEPVDLAFDSRLFFQTLFMLGFWNEAQFVSLAHKPGR